MITGSYVKAIASPWMWAGLAALTAAGYGLGFVHGLEREQQQSVAFREQVAAASATNAAEAARNLKESKDVTERVVHAYGVSFDELARRLRAAQTRGDTWKAAAARTDAGGVSPAAADAGPDSAGPLAAEAEPVGDGSGCIDLTRRCAETTLTCAWMQHWQFEQEAVGGGVDD